MVNYFRANEIAGAGIMKIGAVQEDGQWYENGFLSATYSLLHQTLRRSLK